MTIGAFPRSRAAFFIVDANYFGLGLIQAQQALAMSSEAVSVHLFLEGEELESEEERLQCEAIEARSGGRFVLHRNQLNPRVPDSFPHTEHLPKLVYGRFFAPEIIDAERILYLDADILIRNRLDELFSIDMRGNALAAVNDFGFIARPETIGGPIGDLRSSDYFNAGVLLIDRDRWLTSNLDAKAKAFFAEHGAQATLQDQDFLNWAYRGQWTRLSPRWNFQAALISGGLQTALQPTILHFSGPLKPWHPECKSLFPENAEDLRGMAERAGVSTNWRPKKGRSSYTKPIRSVKYAALRLADASGIKFGKMHKRLDEWRDGRERSIAFLAEMTNRGAFADPITFRIEGLPEPAPAYDGRRYWAAA